MTAQEWIWLIFLFAFGCCIGSFLNVVIYRLPREKSLVRPASACPSCERHIRFYDNIPLVSWIMLEAKCRYCKAPISPRYFIVELLTGSVFAGLYIVYFHTGIRTTMQQGDGTWLVYVLHIVLLAAFIAASGIDLEHWVIPLSICWFVTVVGIAGSAAGGLLIDPVGIRDFQLLPSASAGSAALAAGAAVGLAISLVLLARGVLKRSYEVPAGAGGGDADDRKDKSAEKAEGSGGEGQEPVFNHRLEMGREMLFLAPILLCSVGAWWLVGHVGPIQSRWDALLEHPVGAGLFGSLFGYFVGCAVVWATRIFGTFAFNKEAMGLGDVHLMGAAGAVIGPLMVVLAFFVAPFFGLGWACFQMFFKKIRQIPYGPFLSLGVLAVMISHDWFLGHVALILYR